MSELYGYVRVSSKEQNVDRQLIAMQEFGVPDNHVLCTPGTGCLLSLRLRTIKQIT